MQVGDHHSALGFVVEALLEAAAQRVGARHAQSRDRGLVVNVHVKFSFGHVQHSQRQTIIGGIAVKRNMLLR